MNIAIIGAGYTGLSAAYQLAKNGHHVTIFEKDAQPGGLAVGYQEKRWDWTLEKHYHHWFTNANEAINHDQTIINLAKEIKHEVLTGRPKTAIYVDGEIFQFDSLKNVLLFPKLPWLDKLRMAIILGLIRYNPFWKPLEKINASKFLPKVMGEKAYKMIWEPQFINKFGRYAMDVSLAWFWARLASRTPTLAYPEGGFLKFATHLVSEIEKRGGMIHFNSEVIEVKDKQTVNLSYQSNKGKKQIAYFDKIIFTVPSFLFLKTVPQLPTTYKKKFKNLKMLGATNLVLRLKNPFFKDNTYWLSVCDQTSPVMAIVEHTNFIDKKHYHDEHLVYLGNYLPTDDKNYQLTKEEQLKLFDPFLKTINPDYQKNLIDYNLFKTPFAQPVIPTNYSTTIPSMKTPLPNVFLANMEQVYPWDRGTSNAVALGEKVAQLVQN
ncbi:MAG TPA: FAD-dependent oxidoreductase [Patescibacteria group bacterium]